MLQHNFSIHNNLKKFQDYIQVIKRLYQEGSTYLTQIHEFKIFTLLQNIHCDNVIAYNKEKMENFRIYNRKQLSINTGNKRGAFFVFEGLDKSGKSTQAKLLVKSLEEVKIKAQYLAFPDRVTPTGKIINEYLSNKSYNYNDSAIHLLFTANRFENMHRIITLLLAGVNVIADRYSYSGIAYSSAKEGMDPHWCRYVENGLPVPDTIYFLRLPFDEIKKRPGFGDERYEEISFQAKVLMEFEKLSRECNFTSVDGKSDIKNIQKVILAHSLKTIEAVKNKTVRSFNFITTS